MQIKIGITGHRDLYDPVTKTDCSKTIKKEIDDRLDFLIEKENVSAKQEVVFEAYTSLAAGADILFAQSVLDKKIIKLNVILPYAKEEYLKDFSSKEKIVFGEIMGKANKIEIAVPAPPINENDRKLSYQAAGQKLVNECDVLFAVWDRKPAKGIGGTAEIVEYAKSKKKEVHIIAIRQPANIYSEELVKYFQKFDKEAELARNKFHRTWVTGIIFGLFAVCWFAMDVSLPNKNITWLPSFGKNTMAESWSVLSASMNVLFLLATYYFLEIMAKRRKKEMINKRRGAEFLRAILALSNAMIPLNKLNQTNSDYYQPSIEIQAIEKKAIDLNNDVSDLENAKWEVYRLIHEQIEYHLEKKIKKCAEKINKYEKVLTVILFLFFGVVILNLLKALSPFSATFHIWGNIEIIVSIILPALYAAIEGIKSFNEWEKSIKQSGMMAVILGELKTEILKIENNPGLIKEKAHELRVILDSENSDWATRLHHTDLKLKP